MSEETAEVLDESKEVKPIDDPKEEIKDEDQPKDEELKDGEPKPEEQGEEIVLVREGTRPKLNKQTRKVSDRINQLNAGKAKEKERADGFQNENASLRERLSVTELALEQARNKTTAPTRPNAEDFDDGVNDPKYIESLDKFDDYRLDQKLEQKVTQASQTSSQQAKVNAEANDLKQKQTEHFARADEFNAKNFDEVQDVAIEHLGTDLVNAIIREYPDSELIIYYYGTNPEEAQAMMKIMDKSQVLGVSEIAVLRKELKKQPKSKIVPDPDEPLEGATTANTGIAKSYERKLEKLRENLENKELGGIRAIIDLKKEAKEKGVILE